MTRHRTLRSRVALAALCGALLAASAAAQPRDEAADLRNRLRERYDILALQDGVGLVPRDAARGIRLVEVRDGTVAINGDVVTGRELRDRLGRDADLVLQLTYLSAADQRRVAAPPAAPPAPAAPAPPAGPDVPGADVPAPPEPPQPPDVEREVRRGGDVVRIMGNVTINRDERVEGDVVVVMGNAYIDGEVEGELTVVMGNAYLRPTAVLHDNVNVVGGVLYRDAGARVDGNVDNVAIGGGRMPQWGFPGFLRDTIAGRVGSFAGTLVRIGLLALLTLVVVAVAQGSIERIADKTAADPLRAGLVGFFAQLLFLPVLVITIIVLAVSIIGIPLLLLIPFALFGLLIVCLVGFTGVAYQAGRWVNARFGWTGRGVYSTVLIGVLLIAAITLLARSAAIAGGTFFTWPLSATGYVVEYVAWTLGIGAAILAWLQRRRVSPPPLPAS